MTATQPAPPTAGRSQRPVRIALILLAFSVVVAVAAFVPNGIWPVLTLALVGTKAITGTPRRRAAHVVGFFVVIGASATIASLVAPWPWATTIFIAAVAFGSCFAALLSPAAAATNTALLVVTLIAAFTPPPTPGAAIWRGVAIVCAAPVWALIVAAVGSSRPRVALALATARLYERYADVADALDDGDSARIDAARAGSRVAGRQLRAAMCAPGVAPVGTGIVDRTLAEVLAQAARISADRLASVAATHLPRAASAARNIASALRGEAVDIAAVAADPALPESFRRAAAALAFPPVRPGGWRQALADSLHPRSATLRQATRLTTALVAASIVIWSLALPRGGWVCVAVVVATRGDLGTSWHFAARRAAGTVIGTALAAGVAVVLVRVGGRDVTATLLPLCAVGALVAGLALRRIDYGLGVAGIAAMIVFAGAAAAPETATTVAGIRLLDNVIGVLLGIATAAVIWPHGAGKCVVDELEMFFAALARHCEGDPTALARADIGLRRARDAFGMALAEPNRPVPTTVAIADGLDAADDALVVAATATVPDLDAAASAAALATARRSGADAPPLGDDNPFAASLTRGWAAVDAVRDDGTDAPA